DDAITLRPGEGAYFVPPFIGTGRSSVFRIEGSMPALTSPGFLFALDEYSEAFRTMFDDALELLAREKAPLLDAIKTEKVDHVPYSHVTAPSGEVVSNPPTAASIPYRFDRRDVVEFNLASF